jgi:anaerobic selenocysteine-containing dehydrogenase
MPTYDSFCRSCTNLCAIKVDVEDGRVVHVAGNRDNPLFKGYTCIKGRSQPAYLYHPERLLHSLKRTPYGRFEKIAVEQAMDEIAANLLRIRNEFGPRAIAGYNGTMTSAVVSTAMFFYKPLFDALGTQMLFDPNTLDKGGKQIAAALHGRWLAPSQGFDDPDAALLIGINPIVTYTGFPAGNPGQWLKDQTQRGMQLIVIDPRRSDVAARAHIHLQARPGRDAEILAAMIRIVLAENLFDREFVAANVSGVDALRRCVEPFTPQQVATRAGIDADELGRAARIFANAKRGYAMAGTGPSMSANGSLVEYLVMSLETLCGHWLRAGEIVKAAPTLEPLPVYKAQAVAPNPDWEIEKLRVRGLAKTPAGMPGSALADEILTPGEGQVRALISVDGNPAVAFPDQLKITRALRSLELLVQVDPFMSRTAELAHYIIAPTMPLETAAVSSMLEFMTRRATGYGLGQSYAQYADALVSPPPDSDLIEEWKFLLGVTQRLGLPYAIRAANGQRIELDPLPSTEQLLEQVTAGSRVPLDRIRQFPGGALFPDDSIVVQPKDPDCTDRLDVGNADMLADLAQIATQGIARAADDDEFPLRLLCRRHRHVYNSSCNVEQTHRGRAYNPAYMHSDDLRALGLGDGDIVEIESARAAIHAIVAVDDGVRPGHISMMFGYGADPERDAELHALGSSANRLIADDSIFDRYTGQPRMSNLPVRIRPASAEFLARVSTLETAS